MRLQQSAKPFLCLLFLILILVPIGDHLLKEAQQQAAIEIVIDTPVPAVIAKK